MNIDWDRRLLGPLHAKMGVMAHITPEDGAAFDASVIRRTPSAALSPFQGSTVASNLYVFEVRRTSWPDPKEGDRLNLPGLGAFALQSARPDEKQPEIWLLDCFPD